ncbi:hypothetical protein D3C74_332740 [compost metagenome]
MDKVTKQKLETIMDELGYALREGDDKNRDHYIMNAIRFTKEIIDPDPIPPTIKQGDKVRHKIEGLGTVKKICEDEAIVYFGGLAVRCKIEDLEAYSHD